MDKCQKCKSINLLRVTVKCSDRCVAQYRGMSINDYAPPVTNICGGDYVGFTACVNCGQIQGEFPVEVPEEHFR